MSTHYTSRGLPYPDPADPVKDTPAALQALAAAITAGTPLGLSMMSSTFTLTPSAQSPGSQAILTFPGMSAVYGCQVTTRVRDLGADALLWRTGDPAGALVPSRTSQVLATGRIPSNVNGAYNAQTGVYAIGWGTAVAGPPLVYPGPGNVAREWHWWIEALANAAQTRLPRALATVSGSFTTNANGDFSALVPALSRVDGAVISEIGGATSVTSSVFAAHDMTAAGGGQAGFRCFDGRVNPATRRANYTVKACVIAWGTPATTRKGIDR